jgi:glycosyltransferase involved in cell wall biosynthesis
MTIGLYFECFKKSGGVYQYTLNLLEALKQNQRHNFIVFNISPDLPFDQLNFPNWKIVPLIPEGKLKPPEAGFKPLKESFQRKITLFSLKMLRTLKLYRLEILLTRIKAKKRASMFNGYGIDLMFFHGPSELSFFTDIPAMVPIHDLHHRLHPELPEVSQLGQWQKREYLCKNINKKAYKILVNSKTTKEDLIKFYNIDPNRIEVMPCPPPPYIIQTKVTAEKQQELIKTFNLPKEFLFYPAQFWPHKNHRNLIRAMSILKKQDGQVMPLVLVGSPQNLWGEFERVKKLIEENNLEKDIYILGYVKNDFMPILYSMAKALVMPALYGFTYPVFEAWATNVPVLYSNARDSREQVGNAAILVDPKNPEDIAKKIKTITEDEKLRQTLVKNGALRLKTDTQENLNQKIGKLIDEFENSQHLNHKKTKAVNLPNDDESSSLFND